MYLIRYLSFTKFLDRHTCILTVRRRDEKMILKISRFICNCMQICTTSSVLFACQKKGLKRVRIRMRPTVPAEFPFAFRNIGSAIPVPFPCIARKNRMSSSPFSEPPWTAHLFSSYSYASPSLSQSVSLGK